MKQNQKLRAELRNIEVGSFADLAAMEVEPAPDKLADSEEESVPPEEADADQMEVEPGDVPDELRICSAAVWLTEAKQVQEVLKVDEADEMGHMSVEAEDAALD